MAHLMHYFYNLKTKYVREKAIVDLESTSKNTSIINIIKDKYTQ